MPKTNYFRYLMPLVMCFSLFFSKHAAAGPIGIVYLDGLMVSYNVSSRFKFIVPITLKNVFLDFRVLNKGVGMSVNAYLGVGANVGLDSIMGGAAKAKPGDDGGGGVGGVLGGINAKLRFTLGAEYRFNSYPISIFAEMAPDVNVLDGGGIAWKKFGFGLAYQF